MKKDPLTFILVGVFFLSTVATTALAYKFTSSARKLQDLQIWFKKEQNTELFIKSLYADADAYSKKNPAVLPIMQALTNNNPNIVVTPPAK